MAISEDFQDAIRAACQQCQDGTGDCLVARMRTLANGDEPD